MRSSYNAAATQSMRKNAAAEEEERRRRRTSSKNKAERKRSEQERTKTKRRCADCEEKREEVEEKNTVILTLHKKMDLLRDEVMSQNLELKTKENRIQDLIKMLVKCEYENVKKCEDQMDQLKKDVEIKDYELEITKQKLLPYVNKCESMRDELEKGLEVMKREALLQGKELKDIKKELDENKLLHEWKSSELDEAQRTVCNLNTMVTDLQYVVKKLLTNSANSGKLASDVEDKLKNCDMKKNLSELREDGEQSDDKTLGLAKDYMEYTKRSYNLRQRVRERVKDNDKVDFVFADVNCNLCLKLMDGSYIHFTSEREFEDIIERLNIA